MTFFFKTITIGVVATLVISGYMEGADTAHPKQAQPAELAKPADYDRNVDAAIYGAAALKRSLRNPASFDLIDADVTRAGAVCYQYRAQNGFGGVNVSRAVRSANGKRMLTSEMDGFVPLYNRECAHKKIVLEAAYQVRHYDKTFDLAK